MTDHLEWVSELSLEQVFDAGESFAYPQFLADGNLLYLTTIKSEGGRTVLMLKSQQATECITPTPFSLRTKVSEYGGKPFWVFDGALVFANQADQCLYRQDIRGTAVADPQRISCLPAGDTLLMYTDVHQLPNGHYLAIVEAENLSDQSQENSAFLAIIDPDQPNTQPVVVARGADFYSNLVFDVERQTLAWVQWGHPSMPWDDTELWVAELEIAGRSETLLNLRQIDLGRPASVCQLAFANNGRLFFSADYAAAYQQTEHCDYWNVHVYDPDSNAVTIVTHTNLEFGYPHWQYGDCRIVQIDNTRLLTVGSAPHRDRLFIIDQDSLDVDELPQPQSTLQHLASDGAGQVLAIRSTPETSSRLVRFGLESDTEVCLAKNDIPSFNVSIATPVSFATSDKSTAHAFYYEPQNTAYRSDAKPPLIVMVHGGPTARAYGHFDLQKQFWTSSGFALLDVNHRGSTGYGRVYRDALYGHWGELDANDVVDAVSALVEQGKVDPARICIRGKSAGGYAVLRALTEYPETFQVGACYYGIGNLVTLAESTHKFEKHYTDRLIGEQYDRKNSALPHSAFYTRSPIHKMTALKSAMIVFQGLLDRVVPPALAQEIIAALRSANIDHEYVEYADEAHGFRQAANNIDAWARELKFYRRVLGQRQ